MTAEVPGPGGSTGLRPTIDTVGLDRMRAMVDRSRDAVGRRLLHPGERATAAHLDQDSFARFTGGRLVVKEAWIKALGHRPAGWQFTRAHFRGASHPVPEHWHEFCGDLDLEIIEAGTVTGSGDETPPLAACFGLRGRHLIGLVLS